MFSSFATKFSQTELSLLSLNQSEMASGLFQYPRSGNWTFDSFAFDVALESNIENNQSFWCNWILGIYKYWSLIHHGQR